jgi:hypothetical protein
MSYMKSFAMAVLATVAVTALVSSAEAQDRLRPVGQVEFEPEPYSLEKGVLQIKPEDRRLRALRIEADGGAADVRSFKIIYADGEQERVRVRQTISDGQRTDLFRLEEPRPVKTVEINYIPKGPVTLILLGDSRRAPPPPEFKELGCNVVSFIVDRDVIQVRSEDRFKALRLRSMNHEVEMIEMTVRFGNGTRQNFPIRAIIPANGKSQPIDLRGDQRRIRDIELIYRTNTISNTRTKLCVDGLPVVTDEDDDD